jgi:RNA polymerase sigma-70 factor (ECF subfamily)
MNKDNLSTDQSGAAIDESTLVSKLQRSDEVAWQEFMERYSLELYEYLKRQLPDDEAAQDVLSEIFLFVVREIKGLEKEADLHVFIFTAADQKISAFQRRAISMTMPRWFFEQESPFAEAMAKLTEQQRELLLLRYHQGLSLQEIAHRLGKTVRATELLLQGVRHQVGQIDNGMLLSLLPKDYEVADRLSIQPFFAAIYPMLLFQQQFCRRNEMTAEASIFDRACAALEQMVAMPRSTFTEELRKVVSDLTAEDPAQLIRHWLERHAKYDSRHQL